MWGSLDDDDIPPAAGVFVRYGRGVFGVWEWCFALWVYTPAGGGGGGGGDIIIF